MSWQEVGALRADQRQEELIQAAVDRAIPQIRQGLLNAIKEEIRSAVSAIPAPINGKDGAPGKDAPPVSEEVIAELVESAVGRAVQPGPKGDRGEDGRAPTREEILEVATSVITERQSGWHLEFERYARERFDRFLESLPAPKDGRNGTDGTNGRDALEIEDLDASMDEDGVITLTFKRGTVTREFQLPLPRLRYLGVFEESREYHQGDGVTHGGSLWLAMKDAPAGRPQASEDWRLAVKRGADGKPGKDGERGPQGVPGQDLRYQ